MEEYLKELNEAQHKAATTIKGPVLILAGAGAGKTKTITHRILHLIQKGVSPENILAITFTNKSAKEMRERVISLIENTKSINSPISIHERPFVSTFHALGVRIIKENAAHFNLSPHFSILDRSDSTKAVKEAMERAGVDSKQFAPAKIKNALSKQKGKGLSFATYESKYQGEYFATTISSIWKEYEFILARDGALDFDDLLLKPMLLFRDVPEVRKHYQEKWHYIHIDEYQDTNEVQYTLAKQLTGPEQNICAVGDIDQNIYSWRGAQLKNILHFEKDYPNTTSIVLEENYRSTKKILAVANDIIKKNVFRKEKNLFTNNQDGENISIAHVYDETDEADFVAQKSKELIKNGVNANEIAVLYRANFQSRTLEEAFLNENVSYQLLGTKFFERKEVKDVLAYIKAARNPESLTDIKRILNVPKRGIGKVTLLKLFSGEKETLSGRVREKVESFYNLLARINTYLITHTPSETIKYIMDESGIIIDLHQHKGEDDADRLENIQELVSLALSYDSYPPEEGIEKLLTDAALASDQDSLDRKNDGVRLMTVHASKGLEFDYVFITGLEENLFPHKIDDEKSGTEESEEERRLFYVALTRARKKIYLTHAELRTIFGSKQINMQSEFLLDIDDSFITEEKHEGKGARRNPIFTIDF